MVSAVITGIGTALPPSASQQMLWDGFFSRHFRHARIARRIFDNSGVVTRQGVANPLIEDVSRWPTQRRMQRYAAAALPLGREAIQGALTAAGVKAEDIGLLAMASCTGYTTPGPDILLARELGMPPQLRRLFIGHMGCYAALPGLAAVADYVVAQRRPAVLLCLELTSLHLQPASENLDVEQIVAHALFSDAAAAVVVEPRESVGERDLAVIDVTAQTDPDTAPYMTWEVTDLGFRMGISPQVPDVLAAHVADVVEALLDRHGLTVADVTHWAVHPGGPRILDVVQTELGLPPEMFDASWAVLRDHGNCSSATVLLVLERLVRSGPVGTLVALAFGPGLTLYGGLLRARR